MTEQRTSRIIAGFGRSGTTWVQDVLAESNRLRPVFEPLHPLHIDGASSYANRYIADLDEEPELRQLLGKYICDDYRSLWADYRIIARILYPRVERFTSWSNFRHWTSLYANSWSNYSRYRHQRQRPERIVKLVRANMMLGWLKRTFNARIVFIIRHPAAVVMSQLKAKRSWNPYHQLELYRNDSRLLETLDKPKRALLSEDLDHVSALTLSWCIENTIAVRQVNDNDLTLTFYEDLLRLGEDEWRRVLDALDLSQMPDPKLISQPSQQAWGEKAMDSKLIRQYSLWMEKIDAKTESSIQAMLDAAGMDIYSVDQALPKKTAAELRD
jgi:hypothetical protein